jgi:hypothetical protein
LRCSLIRQRRRFHAAALSPRPDRRDCPARNGSGLDVAGARTSARRVLLRSGQPVRSGAAPRDRRGRADRFGRRRAGVGDGLVRGHCADERQEHHDRDRRRLLGHPPASRLDVGQEGRGGQRGRPRRHDRAERNARIRSALRSPRDPRHRRPAGLPRSAHPPAASGGSPSAGRGRNPACTLSGTCYARGRLAPDSCSERPGPSRSESHDGATDGVHESTLEQPDAGEHGASARCIVDDHSIGACRAQAGCALDGPPEARRSPRAAQIVATRAARTRRVTRPRLATPRGAHKGGAGQAPPTHVGRRDAVRRR